MSGPRRPARTATASTRRRRTAVATPQRRPRAGSTDVDPALVQLYESLLTNAASSGSAGVALAAARFRANVLDPVPGLVARSAADCIAAVLDDTILAAGSRGSKAADLIRWTYAMRARVARLAGLLDAVESQARLERERESQRLQA